MKLLTGKWSFYINGTLLALLIVFCLYLFDDTIGMSDGMVVISEYCKTAVEEQMVENPPPLDWQTGFLLGIFIGGLGAAIISGNWKIRFFQEGETGIIAKTVKTIACGVGGGFLVMLGLQLAGDSFLGQWAAAIQLSGGAWVFIISCFVVASGTAIMLERRREGTDEE
ncbi:MAG: YeeE/YedE family protein [Lentisphaerae bacterium]|nr:YeeE/YedE family protein [Lentisphaerota bacterium]MCP4101496.1 YeeE/YedE family protein [Lentisphaerota bacterium]